MAANNSGSAWASMQSIEGLNNSNSSTHIMLDGFNSDFEFENVLIRFYCRFDHFDLSK